MNNAKIDSPSSLLEHQQALYLLLEEFDRVCKKIDVSYILFAGTLLGAVRHQGFIPWDDDLDVLMLRKDYERFLAEANMHLNVEKFFLQKEFSEHWPMFFSKLRLNGTTCLEKYHPRDPDCHLGVYIDIFPCDNAAKTVFGRKVQFMASKIVIAKALSKRGYETTSFSKRVFMAFCRCLPDKPFSNLLKLKKYCGEYVHTFLGGASGFSKNIYPRKYITPTAELSFCNKCFSVPREYDRLLRIVYGDYMVLPPPEKRKIKQHAFLVDLSKSYDFYREYHQNAKFDVLTRSIR